MISSASTRIWLVRWLYAVVAGHLIVGVLLALAADAAPLAPYHRSIETHFWGNDIPAAAHAQQVWWISLFGPTVQAASIWMAVLVLIADRQRNALAWLGLIAGLLVWAPQDILISLQAQCTTHVWIDGIALLIMLPPLLWLFRHDLEKGRKT